MAPVALARGRVLLLTRVRAREAQKKTPPGAVRQPRGVLGGGAARFRLVGNVGRDTVFAGLVVFNDAIDALSG